MIFEQILELSNHNLCIVLCIFDTNIENNSFYCKQIPVFVHNAYSGDNAQLLLVLGK